MTRKIIVIECFLFTTFIFMMYVGLAMMEAVGIGYLWLAIYTVGCLGLSYRSLMLYLKSRKKP